MFEWVQNAPLIGVQKGYYVISTNDTIQPNSKKESGNTFFVEITKEWKSPNENKTVGIMTQIVTSFMHQFLSRTYIYIYIYIYIYFIHVIFINI